MRTITNDDSLEEFLINDLFDLQEAQGSKDFKHIVMSIFRKASIINYFIFPLYIFDIIYNYFKNKDKATLYFRGIKLKPFIDESKKHFPVGIIVTSFKDRLYAINNNMPYINILPAYSEMNKYFKTKNVKYLKKTLDFTNTIIKKNNISALVLWNDCFPMDRALILSSKENKIPSVQVQIGMYNSKFSPDNGRVSDFVFVWGDFFKRMYKDFKVRNTSNIYTLGYIRKLKKIKPSDEVKSVIYLGQNIEKFNSDLYETKIKTILKLKDICRDLNLNFFYKPHPKDDIKRLKKDLNQISFISGNLEESFKIGDVFISFFSTSLIEATMSGKIAIQLKNYDMNVGNFENLGICKTVFKIEDTRVLLKGIKDNPKGYIKKFNNNYIKVERNVEHKFIDLINEKVLKNV